MKKVDSISKRKDDKSKNNFGLPDDFRKSSVLSNMISECYKIAIGVDVILYQDFTDSTDEIY